jgi:TonB-dependent SusC/RagA subfamily outer membrane receptor
MLLALAIPFILTIPRRAHAQAPTGTLRGRVTDAASGRGIPEAQVTIAGTRIGVLTGQQGEFTLAAVPTGSRTVEARRIGYQPVERVLNVTAGDNDLGTIALSVSAVNLSEVVVTGTGTATEKRAIGTSIATVDSALLSRAEAVTVDQAMQGKIPGAQITQNSGSPGGGGISVRLRGTNSFISGSDPLYIIDGVIVDNTSAQLADLGGRSNPQNRLADINPDDIEHIEVTRGAAAAALYGSRANNGVVQIFTKRGTIGKAHYTASTGSQRANCASSSPSISTRSMRLGSRSNATTTRTTSFIEPRPMSKISRSRAGTIRPSTTSAATSPTKTASCGRRRRGVRGRASTSNSSWRRS